MIGIGTRSKGNVFQLNPTKITCLDANVDNNWLWHKRFCHINFDNTVKAGSIFVVRNFPRIMKYANVVCKECIMAQ